MNIGIVTTWFERGGAYVSRQYRDTLAAGHDVFIYARGGERYAAGDPNWDDACVTWGKKLDVPVPTFIELADFRHWVEINGIELVFFNEQQWWEPVLLCRQLGVLTGAYVDYYTEETIPLFGCYDFLLCNTLRHFSAFQWHPRAFYIPWGTDLQLFPFGGAPAVQQGQVTFFHSAGVSPERKGTDLLLQAFDRVRGAARLVLHAQVDVGAMFPQLNPLMERLAASGRLTLIEKTVPAPGGYHLGDVYVYPSRLDGIGLTIAEALACGLPVITSDSPPMNEVVSDESGRLVRVERWHTRADGYYWPCGTVSLDHLVEQMQFYVDRPSELPRYKSVAREHAERHLDWSRNSAELPELFKRVKRSADAEVFRAKELAQAYEAKRLCFEMKLYRLFPKRFKRVNDFCQLLNARLFRSCQGLWAGKPGRSDS